MTVTTRSPREIYSPQPKVGGDDLHPTRQPPAIGLADWQIGYPTLKQSRRHEPLDEQPTY